VSWNCSGSPDYNCFDPGTGQGKYSNLQVCKNNCKPPSPPPPKPPPPPPPPPPSQTTYYKCDGSKCIVDTTGGTDYKNDPTCAKKCGKSNTPMLVIILITIILMVLGSVGIYFIFGKKK
jgi:hypothetical protein